VRLWRNSPGQIPTLVTGSWTQVIATEPGEDAGEAFMIIRVWTALAAEQDQHKYCEHFRTSVLPTLQRLEGYQGATLSSRRSDEGVEILVITRWRSAEAGAGFRRTGPGADGRRRRSALPEAVGPTRQTLRPYG
jgi:heme-degrading monooxygenase HmoA